jgi:hypothetical protein
LSTTTPATQPDWEYAASGEKITAAANAMQANRMVK